MRGSHWLWTALIGILLTHVGCDRPVSPSDVSTKTALTTTSTEDTLGPSEYSGDFIEVSAYAEGFETCSVSNTYTDSTYWDYGEGLPTYRVEVTKHERTHCENITGGWVDVTMTADGTTKHLVEIAAGFLDGDVAEVIDGEYATLSVTANTAEDCSFSHWRLNPSGNTSTNSTLTHYGGSTSTNEYIAVFDCGGSGGPLGGISG